MLSMADLLRDAFIERGCPLDEDQVAVIEDAFGFELIDFESLITEACVNARLH